MNGSDQQGAAERLAERVILVTGAADAIGQAVAAACAAQGATVVLSDQNTSDLEGLYDRIEEAGWPQPAIMPIDLTGADAASYDAVAATLAQTFGRLDGLAHCASYAHYLSRIDDYGTKEWQQTVHYNLTAPFMLIRACLPLLRAAQEASIVLTTDRVGRKGLAYWGAYAAAKAGLEAFMETLAEETRDSTRIRVNSLDPGVVRSGMRARLYPGENPEHLPTADSLVPWYLYLLGPDSSSVSGRRFTASDRLP